MLILLTPSNHSFVLTHFTSAWYPILLLVPVQCVRVAKANSIYFRSDYSVKRGSLLLARTIQSNPASPCWPLALVCYSSSLIWSFHFFVSLSFFTLQCIFRSICKPFCITFSAPANRRRRRSSPNKGKGRLPRVLSAPKSPSTRITLKLLLIDCHPL